MRQYTYSFLLYAFITLLTESAVVLLLLRKSLRIGKRQLTNKEIVSATVCASSLTIPYVWFVFPNLFENFATAIWISEFFVFVVEVLFYRMFLRLSYKQAFLISFIANIASFGLGKILHALFANS
jgi:hypothetical protein